MASELVGTAETTLGPIGTAGEKSDMVVACQQGKASYVIYPHSENVGNGLKALNNVTYIVIK